MPRLLDRNRQIPNGMSFLQPETGWRPRKWASFEEIVVGLIAHRIGNPALVIKHNWATEKEAVSEEVDSWNAKWCEQMQWTDFISAAGGQSIPFPHRSVNPFGPLPKLAAGAKVQVEWIDSKEDAVPIEVAEKRAAICVKCPKNGKGDWTRFFTVPVSNEIRRQLEIRRGWNLRTSHDEELKVCEACSCPLPLKMHIPIERILKNLPPESKADLDPGCWILLESNHGKMDS